AAVGVQVAEALAAAHELGILHRDVKPANVMRDRFGRHKLGDFGIAGLASSAQTTAGAAAATVAYAAPEVLLGKRATAASDLYGLGATLYALLSGAPAFASETDESIVPMVMRVTSDPPPELPVAIAPDAFRSLLASLMVKDPAGRPADAVQVGSMLKAIEASHLLETTQTHSPPVEEAETVSLATSRLADPEVPAVERADPVAPPLGGEQTVVHERPDPGAAPNAPTVLPRPDRAGPSSWDPQPEAPSGGSGGASSGRGGEGAPPLPVGGPPPATPGRAPSIGARALASILDWAVLAALMGVAFALIAPFGYPTHDVIMTFEPGGSSTRVDLGLSGVTMTADDYGTTVTVRNETDDVLRVALAPHGAGESDRYPTNGATVDPRSERTFGLGKLPAGSYDVVLVGADRSDTAVFDGSSGVGAIRLEAAPGFGVAEVIAIGALAAAVLAVGWPVAAILALTSLLTVLSDPWDHVSGARAVFGAVVLLVALVYEVVVRWRREASIGESVAHIAVGSASGGRASFGALLVRWLAKPISSIPVLAGYWWP
ncbi:MAG: protein kinase, partial [Acidimicrobiales bacterium]|nr:protein kinase [Acidimicrobiales bacterium]